MKPNIITRAAFACVALIFTTFAAEAVTATEARAIAKEAYIYGFPIVDNYRLSISSSR